MKILPGVYQFVTGEVSLSKMKDVAVEDLLGREPIKVNMDEIFRYICGKTILVTGGGGSIGSELCRQIAAHAPKRLVIFDVYENNAYDIEQELRSKYPHLDLVVLIGSVRDTRKINDVCFLQIAKMQQIRFVNGLHRPERMHRGISMKNLAITTE